MFNIQINKFMLTRCQDENALKTSGKQHDTYDIDVFKWKIYAHLVVKL